MSTEALKFKTLCNFQVRKSLADSPLVNILADQIFSPDSARFYLYHFRPEGLIGMSISDKR